MTAETLIFVATYNERENAEELIRQLEALGLGADLLFVDDASPDGTGALLDELARDRSHLHVIHRAGKLGVGSAHQDGIAWAYERGYHRLVTLDCDFSHRPTDIPRMLAVADGCDVVVGSRWSQPGSLPSWKLHRRVLTTLGHSVTKRLLGVPYDATGALRLYDLKRIPRRLFDRVESKGYSFFLESMYLLWRNGYRIREVPIVLPARTYGHSKMTLRDVSESLRQIQELWLARLRDPERFQVPGSPPTPNPDLAGPQLWDAYWSEKASRTHRVYDAIATTYRNRVIRPRLGQFVRKHFAPGSALLHAGCGSGQVDVELQRDMNLTAADISLEVLKQYTRTVPRAQRVEHADVLALPFADDSFDGAYNLGVVEHFSAEEIRRHFRELARVVRPGGKILVFWPHAQATSVRVLNAAHWILERTSANSVRLHPAEISLLSSRGESEDLARELGLSLLDYEFGMKDLFVQAVVVFGVPSEAS